MQKNLSKKNWTIYPKMSEKLRQFFQNYVQCKKWSKKFVQIKKLVNSFNILFNSIIFVKNHQFFKKIVQKTCSKTYIQENWTIYLKCCPITFKKNHPIWILVLTYPIDLSPDVGFNVGHFWSVFFRHFFAQFSPIIDRHSSLFCKL